MATSEMIFWNEKGERVYYKSAFTYPDTWAYNDALMFAKHYSLREEASVEESLLRILSPFRGKVDPQVIEHAFDLMFTQRACLNSPAMFNLGANPEPIASACFIVSVEDDMMSIADLYTKSMMIFKQGAGMGASFHNLRGSMENLSRSDGVASGPVSFMRILDRVGNVVKSGGRLRRAAIMVINRVDHPDIYEFINCKLAEEKKAKVLSQAGYGAGIESESYQTVAFQNMNISVSVTDEFMKKSAIPGATYDLKFRTTGESYKSEVAEEVLEKIAEICWETGDPGIQFFDTINRDNPFHELGEKYTINASNPCISGDSYVLTSDGWRLVSDLDGTTVTIVKPGSEKTSLAKFFKTGTKDAVRSFMTAPVEDSLCIAEVITTPDHKFRTDRGYIPCEEVTKEDKVFVFDCKTKEILHGTIVDAIDMGEQEVYDFTVLDGSEPCGIFSYPDHRFGVVLHNCSEFTFLDNSACNLASINLNKFLQNGAFQYSQFCDACRTLIYLMDAIIDIAHYPTQEITDNSRNFRPLGLGYTGLGSLLMRMGIAYGSKEACNITSLITQTMTETAWRTSHELFLEHGCNLTEEEQYHLTAHVIEKFGGEMPIGYRNSQVTLLAPTGTISFVMGTGDSTGIEPIMALEATKTVVGGGTIRLTASAAEEAVAVLGKSCLKEALEDPKTRPVFATSYGEVKVSPQEHMDMMEAAQRWLSGAISKTIAFPNSATVSDIKDAYRRAWEMGLKCVAIYRDGSKMSQPVNVNKKPEVKPKRERMPETRDAITHHFEIMGEDGYITLGRFPDGRIGEIFVSMQKQGSTVQGLLHSWSIAISMALQYGAPLDDIIRKYRGMKFDPSGFTINKDIEMCHSVVDYVSQYIIQLIEGKEEAVPATHFVPADTQESDNTRTCPACGNVMRLVGTCHLCSVCGTSGGCS